MANYTLMQTLTNASIKDDKLNIIIAPNTNYKLPDTVTVSNGTLSSYDKNKGLIIVTNARDNLTVTAECVYDGPPLPTMYIVSFDANGGSGTMESVQVEANSSYALPACTFTAPTGKEFDAWRVGSDTTPQYPGYKITVIKDIPIRALWKASTPPTPTGDQVQITFAEDTNNSIYDGQDYTGTYLGDTDDTYTITSGYVYIAPNSGEKLYSSGELSGDISLIFSSKDTGSLFKVDGDGAILGYCQKCFVAGTRITLADYTTKNVEDITYDDTLLVYDFTSGKLTGAKPSWIMVEQEADFYHRVVLSDGTVLKLAGPEDKCHRLFNVTKQQMLYATECVGDEVYKQDGTIATVISHEIINEHVKYYNLTTETYYDCFAEGVLTGSRLNNMYHISNMKYDSDTRLISEEEEAERWKIREQLRKCN